jgi:hypothetical protein
VITPNGDVHFSEKGVRRIICADGRIGRFARESWNWVDSSGEGFQKVAASMKHVRHRCEFLTDYGEQITKMIREDGIRFTYDENRFRKIEFPDFITVHQRQSSVSVAIPQVPTITVKDKEFAFSINETTVKMAAVAATINSSRFQSHYAPDGITLSVGSEEGVFTAKRCEFHSGEFAFAADVTGCQRIGYIVSDSTILPKKLEDVRTKWGKLQPLKDTFLEVDQVSMLTVFRPRFFAIRKDLSATEFIPESAIADVQARDRSTEDSRGTSFVCTTFHHPTAPPRWCVHHIVLAKPARQTLLKGLHAPSARSKRSHEPTDTGLALQESGTAHTAMLAAFQEIRGICETVKNENEALYQKELHPPPRPPSPEPKAPVSTPSPRVLIAQSLKSVATVDQENYWVSPEANFATPIDLPRTLAKPLASRTALFDAPPEKRKRDDPPPIQEDEFSAQPTQRTSPRSFSARVYKTEVSQPQTPHMVERVVDFGTVRVGEIARGTVVLDNPGTKPLRCTFTPPAHASLKLETPAATIPPGLKLTVTVAVKSDVPQMIRSSFIWRTPDRECVIPIFARIVQ